MKIGDLVKLGMLDRTTGKIRFSDMYGIIMDFDDCDLYDVLCYDGETYIYSEEELELIR